jgi:hypothetical protein
MRPFQVSSAGIPAMFMQPQPRQGNKVISEKTITSAMVFQIMLQASVSLILAALGICTTK